MLPRALVGQHPAGPAAFCVVLHSPLPGYWAGCGRATRSECLNDTTLASASVHRSPTRLWMHQGRHRVALSRIADGRTFTPGLYLLRVTSANANGQSAVAKVKFWIVGSGR